MVGLLIWIILMFVVFKFNILLDNVMLICLYMVECGILLCMNDYCKIVIGFVSIFFIIWFVRFCVYCD